MKACELDVPLPWCGDFKITIGNRSSDGIKLSSTSREMSPVINTDTWP